MSTGKKKQTGTSRENHGMAERAAGADDLILRPLRTTCTLSTTGTDPTARPDAKPAPQPDLPDQMPPGPCIRLFEHSALSAWIVGLPRRSSDGDINSRNRALAQGLHARSHFRALHSMPRDWEQQLDALEVDYPHFAAFFAYVRTMCALAAIDDGVVELEAALLDGLPGTGKSTVIERLAGIIGSHHVRISMSAAESGALIGGSQETWSNSKPGLVFSTLTEGYTANPIFLLDEIDKVSVDPRWDPLGPLYQLLEPALAKSFTDLSVTTLPIDASRIVWIATSNDARRIPQPIRQRFVQFDIPLPTPAQSLAVARSVMRWLQEQRPRFRRFMLDGSAEDALIGLAPRQMRKQITLGCGQAARAGRAVVTAADFPVDASQGRRIGF